MALRVRRNRQQRAGESGDAAAGDFKDYVVPTWRISDKEPIDLKKGPAIPADAKWKFSG